MINFNRGGSGLPQGQGYIRLRMQNNRLRDRLLLPLERYRSDALLVIFCVLFSTALVTPAFGQETDGLPDPRTLKGKVKDIVLKDNDGGVVRKAVYNYSLYGYVVMKPYFIKTIYDRNPDADYKKFPLGTYEIDIEKLPKIRVGDKIADEIMDLPLWVVNNEYGSDTITLRQMSAKQWMVLDVWDEYCTPCIKSMNHWEHFLKTHSDKLNFLGLYMSFYPHRVPIIVRKRGYLSTQIIGSSSSILAKSFLGDGSCLGPNIWIKDGVLFGIANANTLSDEEYLSILSGKMTEMPAHARFNQYWSQH
ncbi:hypothetical protein [Sphingobacterium yanglingense]|uniref:Uncharacterized protein n=1 Tax=Sphingobacterium yanglingense TaxID=1437280 RepID=A0A4R6WCE3_9SPHI|nr:hypothetical protein [Sphingobacterium yanglingense]TDQ75300.1 hypothetical protein CLV99_3900 [Sphingobacterium yanglingense]